MKTFLLSIGLIFSLILQLFLFQSWQSEVIVPNVVLAFIIVASLYTKTEQLLWMSLIAGLFCDIYSSSDFGFYIGFYLLVGILAKYLLKFGEVEYSWWRPLLFLAFMSAAQVLAVSAGIFSSMTFWSVTRVITTYVTYTVVVGLIWYLVIYQADEFIKRLTITKAIK
jgi:rod shape-determining protein MreD